MPKVRDTQRSRVYKAEDILKPISKPLPEIKDIEKYLDKIFKSAWWKKNFIYKEKYIVKDGRGRRRAAGDHYGRNGVWMTIPKWARTEYVVLHELAHGLAPLEAPWHGAEFCNIYARLVQEFMGEEAYNKLTFSFRDHKVLWLRTSMTIDNEEYQSHRNRIHIMYRKKCYCLRGIKPDKWHASDCDWHLPGVD